VRLAQWPGLVNVASNLKLLKAEQRAFIEFAAKAQIRWADATKHIPEPEGSVEVLYCSHMLEHLDTVGVEGFLREAQRVLRPHGIIRIAVPNIRYHVDHYLSTGDADEFISRTHLTKRRPDSVSRKFAYLAVGDRHHQWMYDGSSLCRLLLATGYENAQIMDAGTTNIYDPGALDLSERFPESVFVEAFRPA
jgi:predicted SAM-dependent methyltransferase